MESIGGKKNMQLKYKEIVNKFITNKIDLGTIVYTENRISDNHIENSLYDVYARPSVYKQNAFYDIESDCKAVHGYGLHVTSHNANFFSTVFYVKLDGTLYAIVDTPSKRIAYTNDIRFDFSSVKVRVYGCRDTWVRDNVRNLVKPYLKAIGAKKARVDYIGFDNGVGYKILVNNSHMNQVELENYNQEHYKTYIKL